MRKWMVLAGLTGALTAMGAVSAGAAEVKVLTAGAYKTVIEDVAPAFEKQTGNKLVILGDAVGQQVKRVEQGDAFDVVIVTPAAIDALDKQGKFLPGTRTLLARVGVGVVVKEGAPKPDISTVEGVQGRRGAGGEVSRLYRSSLRRVELKASSSTA